MRIETHKINDLLIAEVMPEGDGINTTEEGLELLGDLYYQGFAGIVIHERNIHPDFFILKNGKLGELLQKFSNYRMRLVLVGDFTSKPGNSIQDFIYESNKGRQVNFVNSLQDALAKLSA